MPYEPVRWQPDTNADDPAECEHQRLVKQVHVQTLINMYRVRGHLIAHLDPLDAEPPHIHPELDPLTYGLTIWDLPRGFVADGLAGRDVATLDEILHLLRDAYCRTLGHRVHAHPGPRAEALDPAARRGGAQTLDADEQRHILDRLNAAEVFERFLHTRYVGQKRFGLEGAESTIVLLDTLLDEAAVAGTRRGRAWAWPTGAASTCWPTSSASPTGRSSRSSRATSTPSRCRARATSSTTRAPSASSSAARASDLPVTLASNPSHLEAVDPVVEGMARAKQDRLVPPTDGTPAHLPTPRRLPGAVAAGPRRRRLRRPGRGGRDPQPLGPVRLPDRRHRARGHQQPARLHHRARGRRAPRCTRPTWPRWSRRRSST